jgi:hypothetical protein
MRAIPFASLLLLTLNGCALFGDESQPVQMVYSNTTESGFTQSIAVRSRDGQTVRLPLTLRNGMPTIACLINGEQATVAIDSGSSIFGVFRDRAGRFGIDAIGGLEVPSRTSGGMGTLSVGTRAVIVFDPWLAMKIDAPLLFEGGDLKGAETAGEIDALLGGPALAMLNAVIDYQNRDLRLSVSVERARAFSEEMKIVVGEFEEPE